MFTALEHFRDIIHVQQEQRTSDNMNLPKGKN